MPCAKISITHNIFKTFNKSINNDVVKFCGSTLIIPIVSLSSSFPFKPKGIIIGSFTIYSNLFKKISKKKINMIIRKYNRIIESEYICDSNKRIIEDKLIDEVELFIKYIGISMGWEEDTTYDNYKICMNKTDYWECF